MAFRHDCVRCGFWEEEHDPNLINERRADVAQAYRCRDGYHMRLITCVSRDWPKRYAKKVERLDWDLHELSGFGYVSPCPEKEAAEFVKEALKPLYLPVLTRVDFDPITGRSVVLIGE